MVRVFIVTLLFLTSKSYGSSCCGQSASNYTVLLLKQKTALNVGFGFADVEGRVFSGENFYVWPQDKNLSRSKLSLDGAYEISERHQVFGSLSIVKGEYGENGFGESSSGSSDLVFGYTYELFPEYTYSKWKPVVYVSTFLNLPTGTSIYEDESLTEGAGVTGHGQYGLGVGLTLKKVFYPLTLLVQAKVMRLFEENFDAAKVSGFYGGTFLGLVTYNSSLWGLGFSTGLTHSFLSKRTLEQVDLTSGSSNVNTLVFSLQKTLSEDFSFSISYSDQTLVGTPKNTLLSKAYSLNLQYNFFN